MGENAPARTAVGDEEAVKPPPLCPKRLILFCCNLFTGLILSQLIPEWIDAGTYKTYKHIIRVTSMFHLSYIMINVGFEFDLDKSNLRKYAKDYLVACTAAAFPWIFCSLYFMFALGEHNVEWKMALVAGRFAAPTSAGILFTMLEAAGLSETWLFKKARILAIFDDLDTLLLMVPLKALVVGAKWELCIDLAVVLVCLVCMYKFLHRLHWSVTWYAIAAYAATITLATELTYEFTHSGVVDPGDVIETVHLEVLLPAFTVGCVCVHHKNPKQVAVAGDTPPGPVRSPSKLQRELQRMKTGLAKVRDTPQENVKFVISAVFMVLVGLSMPSLFQPDPTVSAHRMLAEGGSGDDDGHAAPSMSAGLIVLHVAMCTLLMNAGKLFPSFCYRDEANQRTRIALAIGMMPRGEVCAGIIVNAQMLGASGPAITIAVLCLAVNMTCVSGFITAVKKLADTGRGPQAGAPYHVAEIATTTSTAVAAA